MIIIEPGERYFTVPGDIIFVDERNLLSWAIKIGQRVRHPWSEARWNHVAIAAPGGQLVEARANGVHMHPASKYVGVRRAVWNTTASFEGRSRAMDMLSRQLGESYGFADLVSVGLRQLFGVWLPFGVVKKPICSELGAESVLVSGVGLEWFPEETSPADLFEELSAK